MLILYELYGMIFKILFKEKYMAAKRQNHELSLAKFIFAILIVVIHTKSYATKLGVEPFFSAGWSGTEFFFIVSGYLMAISARKFEGQPIGKSTFDFVMRKIKSIYPFYIIGLIISFAAIQLVFITSNTDRSIFEDIMLSLNELLLLQGSGIKFELFYNGPTWYISAMIIAMMVLFPILVKFRDWYVNIGGLTISVFVYAFISQNVVTFNGTTTWIHFTTLGILRAVAGLSLGVFLFGLVDKIKQRDFTLKAGGRVLLFLSEIGAGVILFYIMKNLTKLKGKYQFDFIMIVIITYICFVIFSELTQINNILPAKLCAFLGKISLPVYLLHRAVVWFYMALDINLSLKKFLLVYLATTVAVVIVAHFVLYICGVIRKKLGPKVYSALVETKEIN